MRIELDTLMAAAVAVADTCAATARTMAAYGRASSGEQEQWMLCSIMTAALACTTSAVGTQGTQNFRASRDFYKRSFESCVACYRMHDSQGAVPMRRPVREQCVPSIVGAIRDLNAQTPYGPCNR